VAEGIRRLETRRDADHRAPPGSAFRDIAGKALADALFTPGQPRTRKIFTRDANGRITGFASRREERDVVFTRIK
jgi:hypothetical protein